MKKKLFTLLTLLCLCVTGAWAAVTDLAFTSTKTVTAGGEIWWTTATNVATANTSGWCSNMATFGSDSKYGNITPSLSGDVTDTNPAYHSISGVLVKGGNAPVMSADGDEKGKKALAFKVTNATAITVYGATTGSKIDASAGLQWSIYKAGEGNTWTTVASSAKGKAASPNETATISISGLSASETYIVSIEGGYKGTAGSDVGSSSQDVVVYAVKFAAPNAGAPTINTQPVSASYESGDVIAALTVAATASSGDLSYQWYSCEDTEKSNPQPVGTNSSSYTPEGVGYYYCNVTDGGGSTSSNVATITVVNAFTPSISYSDPAVTITYTGSGKVYYTTDGTEPSSINGTEYSEPFNLTNSCTVRAVAKKGENYSGLVKYDCYVDQSSAEGFLISTGSHSGTNSGSVWTSNDGSFTLSKTSGDFQWCNNLFPGMHGHKMDNGTAYTLQPSEDIKITSIKIVGRTWLEGNAATVTVSGATPSSETWLAGEDGHVSYILTKEFTTSAGYGEAVTVTPANNQFGCFLEVYGVKRSGPADPTVGCVEITYSGGTISDGTWTGTTGTDVEGYSLGTDISLKSGTSYFQLPASTTFTVNVPSGVTVSSFSISGYSNSASAASVTYNESGKSFPKNDNVPTTQSWMIENPSAGKSISFTTGGKDLIVSTITLNTGKIYLTTTANMAGWRSFYDADQGYTLDGNTTAYIATSSDNTTTVWLKPIERGVPAATPVILHTTSSADDSYKMTLTKATVAPYSDAIDGTNLLTWETTAVSNKYRLGYGEDGLGFYPYSGTPSNGAVILNVSSMNARTLGLLFESETTGISNLNVNNNDNIDANAPMYNLAGQKVGKNYKGIVIVNGKKVVRK